MVNTKGCQWKMFPHKLSALVGDSRPCGDPAICDASCRGCGGFFGYLCERHADELASLFDGGFGKAAVSVTDEAYQYGT